MISEFLSRELEKDKDGEIANEASRWKNSGRVPKGVVRKSSPRLASSYREHRVKMSGGLEKDEEGEKQREGKNEATVPRA